MGVRDADIRGWVTQALRYLKMQAATQELMNQSQGQSRVECMCSKEAIEIAIPGAAGGCEDGLCHNSSDKEMVPGNDGVEWARMFREWLESHRVKWRAPDQTVVLFVDSGPTRGNMEALERYGDNASASPCACFAASGRGMGPAIQGAQFRDGFRAWSGPHPTASFGLLLAPIAADSSPTMVRRAQIVGGGVDAAQSATTRSVCVTAFAVAG
jgi:hypothetical protein